MSEVTLFVKEYFGEDDEYNHTEIISVKKGDDFTISDYVNKLIRPLMISHGFSKSLVDEYIPECGD